MPRLLLLFAVLTIAIGAVGCAECDVSADCEGLGETCSAGTCLPIDSIFVTSSTSLEGGPFDVEVAARFAGKEATVVVVRDASEPGDPCVAFAPVTVVLRNDGADHDVVTATIGGLPQLGTSFRLVFTLDVGGIQPSTAVAFSGPPLEDDIGGFELARPREGALDVVDTPMIAVETVGTAGAVAVVVRPEQGIPPPRLTLFDVDGGHRRDVLLVRGRQTVDVEATIDGVVHRCSRFIEGTSRDGDPSIEFLLVSDSADVDDPHWLELSALRSGSSDAAICDAGADASCTSRPTPLAPQQRIIDNLTMSTVSGFVDVAVVPSIASGPVSAQVRVTHRGAHVGVFGPITLQPAAGESWIAGRVILRDGVVVAATPSTAPPQAGPPW